MDKKLTNPASVFDEKYVYFEKQGRDMMCGVHCINALL